MANAIGQLIGVQKVTASIKNADGTSFKGTLKIDFSSSTDNEIIEWVLANRVIRWANARRDKRTVEQLEKEIETVYQASDIGKLDANPVEKMLAKASSMSKEQLADMIRQLNEIANK